MDSDFIVLLIGAAIFTVALFLFIKILSKPIKFIFKLLINAATGYVLLWIVNFFSDYIGVQLETSFLNVMVSGILGIPGVVGLVIYYLYF